jgi:hypothetical protein
MATCREDGIDFPGSIKTSNFLTSRGTVTFSRRALLHANSFSLDDRVRFAAAAEV